MFCASSHAPHKQRRLQALASVASLAALLAACVSETITIPPVEPRRVELPGAPKLEPGSALEREHKKLVAGFGGEYRSPKVQSLLADIAERLRLVSDRPNEHYKITVLNSPSVNAFALPNGYVYLTRGLLALANDTAEVASVVSHEIAHVTARHAAERAELESRSALVSRVMAEVLDNQSASQLMRDQSRVALASFSRQQEIDADEMGVRAVARAGYEAHGATRFLIALDRSATLRGEIDPKSGPGVDILSTHPTTPERIAKALSTARQYGSPGIGEANRMQWLLAVEGLAYGDDSDQGLVLGRRFVHPRLRFAFEAPEGFVLENTAQAVLGVTPGAKQALRLDSSKVEPNRSLVAVLAANPIEGLPVTELAEMEIGGLPAATGIARGPEWAFRVIVIRSGDHLYRLIYAAEAMDQARDQSFLSSARSFQRLSEDEAKAIKPKRLRLVKAQSGETIEAFVAQHMGDIPQALERFLILNGLGTGDMLKPGETYKVITS